MSRNAVLFSAGVATFFIIVAVLAYWQQQMQAAQPCSAYLNTAISQIPVRCAKELLP